MLTFLHLRARVVMIYMMMRSYFDTHVHQWMFDQRMISINYLNGWFALDFLAVFPFEVRRDDVVSCQERPS